MPDETVRTRIEIDGAQALKTLKEIDKAAKSIEGKQKLVANYINDFARIIGKSYEEAEKKVASIFRKAEGGKLSENTKNILGGAREINEQARRNNTFLTLDPKADASIRNYDGSLKKVSQSLVESRMRAQALSAELDKLFKPQQQRNIFGQFTNKFLPDFKTQFNSLDSYNKKLQLVQRTIEGLSKKTGAPFRDVGRELEKAFPDIKNTNLVSTAIDNLNKKAMGLGNTFKSLKQIAAQVDAELAKLTKSGRLNLTGTPFQNNQSVIRAMKEIKEATGASFEQIAAGMRRMGVDGAVLRRSLGEVNKELTGFRHGIDVVKTALGTLTAVAIFQFISAITEAFGSATKNAQQLEETLYRLGNVERILSKQGVEITTKGLEEGIQRIKDLFPIFSREDIAGLVGQVAISTKELGLTEKQILDLAQAIVVLNLRSTEAESVTQTGQKVISSLLTSNAKGVATLGLAFSQSAMEAKGLELRLLDADTALSDLNDQEKGQIKLAIALENTGQEIENLSDFLGTNTAKIAENKASWNDFLTFIGQQINNLIPDISGFVEELQKASELSAISKLFTEGARNDAGRGKLQQWQDSSIWFKLGTGIKLTADEYARLKEILSTFSEEELLKIFPDPSAIKDRFTREIVQSLVTIEDTATNTEAALEDLTDFEGAEEFGQKLQEIADDFQDALEDLNTRRDQKLADLDTEYLRKAEDAQTDYLRKVADINRDYERDLAKLREKHREEDKRAEEKYQLALWELRQRYLMDLEDALHARDARQVIRLQKQYNLDKEILRRKHELENKEREANQAAEFEDLERRRQERLADARLEYEQKLADLNLAKQRELDDLNKWYERELADLQLAMERRAQALIDAGIREKTITENNAAEVYKVLLKYFGPGGLTDKLNEYMMNSLTAAAAGSLNALYGLANSINPFVGGVSVLAPEGSLNNNQGLSAGTNPFTDALADSNLTPLNGMTKNIGRTTGNRSSGNTGMNGTVKVFVDLSPDLEGRIVEQSMDGVGEMIARVNRSK